MKSKNLFLSVFLTLLGGPALAQNAPGDPIAIVGAKVIVSPGKVLDEGTVLMSGGRVTAVGADVKVPAGARRIDGAGKVVTAGLIDAYDSLGLVEVELEATTREGQFHRVESAIHAAYRVTDGYNPYSVTVQVARTGGITSSVVVPRGGLVSGQAAWMSLGHGPTTSALAIEPVAAVHVTLGVSSLEFAEGSRGIAVENLRELLDDAREYARRRSQFERRQTRDFAASRLDLEALAEVTSGRVPLLVRADRVSDILAALSIAEDQRIKVIIAGGAEAWVVADALARARVPVLIDPTRNLPSTFDQLRVRNDGPALLRKAGVPVILSVLGDAAQARTLRQLGGVAVAYGMSWDDAFAAITATPAQVFGQPGRGTLERGSPADIVVWSGDPLELSSRPLLMFTGGKPTSLETHQTRLFHRYR